MCLLGLVAWGLDGLTGRSMRGEGNGKEGEDWGLRAGMRVP
jgi:hypothetical protein